MVLISKHCVFFAKIDIALRRLLHLSRWMTPAAVACNIHGTEGMTSVHRRYCCTDAIVAGQVHVAGAVCSYIRPSVTFTYGLLRHRVSFWIKQTGRRK